MPVSPGFEQWREAERSVRLRNYLDVGARLITLVVVLLFFTSPWIRGVPADAVLGDRP